MRNASRERRRYDVEKFLDDMDDRGWLAAHLAREAGVSHTSVTRFLSGERRSPPMAKRLALALGFPVRRYLVKMAPGPGLNARHRQGAAS